VSDECGRKTETSAPIWAAEKRLWLGDRAGGNVSLAKARRRAGVGRSGTLQGHGERSDADQVATASGTQAPSARERGPVQQR